MIRRASDSADIPQNVEENSVEALTTQHTWHGNAVGFRRSIIVLTANSAHDVSTRLPACRGWWRVYPNYLLVSHVETNDQGVATKPSSPTNVV